MLLDAMTRTMLAGDPMPAKIQTKKNENANPIGKNSRPSGEKPGPNAKPGPVCSIATRVAPAVQP